MAYVSLYRKYRPETFAEVVGQQHVTTTLAHAVDTDRLHHAYLFTGPRGTGKTSTARILAKSLNCEAGPTSEPDGTCAHCRQIAAGAHVDVIEIDAASHGGVDDVRDLRERVAFAPGAARMKVYIVDECHMLSTAGWNAFLKTVEEPPGHVLFIFATTEPHKVLPTILSRTQRFDFKRLRASDLAAHVTALATAEGARLEPAAVDLIVRAGDGSARDTISVLEQVVAFAGVSAGPIDEHVVADVLGTAADQVLEEMVGLLATGDVGGLCLLVQRLADSGADLRQFARDAVAHLRGVFLVQVAPEADLPEAGPERLARLRTQADTLGRVELVRAIELLSEAQAQMRRGNTRLPLEIALAKAAMPDAAGDPAALAARIDRLERGQASVAAPSLDPAPAPVDDTGNELGATAEIAPDGVGAPGESATGPQPLDDSRVSDADPDDVRSASGEDPSGEEAGEVTLARVSAQWPRVLDEVKTRSRRLHAFLSPGRPAGVAGSVVTVEFGDAFRFHAEQCGADEWRDVVVDVLTAVYGVPLQLLCTVGETAASQPAAQQPATLNAPSPAGQAADESDPAMVEDVGETEGDAALHDLAIERLESELGATVIEDRRGH